VAFLRLLVHLLPLLHLLQTQLPVVVLLLLLVLLVLPPLLLLPRVQLP
jgi:hypothetical protein